MLSEVVARVDLDYFYTYWAMEVLLNHRDGYAAFSNNFYLIATLFRIDFISYRGESIIRYMPINILLNSNHNPSLLAEY